MIDNEENTAAHNLTPKQEAFCQAYVKLGDKSAAYREAYDTSTMKPETVHEKACLLSNSTKVKARIETLLNEAQDRNRVEIDEVIKTAERMLRFDIADLYDEKQRLKPINEIPEDARLMIQSIDTEEIWSGTGKDRELIGYTKKVRIYSKEAALEKFMKHFGQYSRDNEQSKATIILNVESADALLGEAK